MLTRGYPRQGRARANVRRDQWSLRHTRRLLKVHGHVPQAYIVFPPDGLKSIDGFRKLRTGSRLQSPAQPNDIGELFRPWMIVRDLWPSVLL